MRGCRRGCPDGRASIKALTIFADLMSRMADQQAFMRSVNDIFYVSAVLFLLLIAVVWLARPPKGAGSAEAAAGAH